VLEGEPVRVFVGLQRRFVHESADGKMRHHQPVEFLAHQVRGLAAQCDLGAAQVRFQFIQRGLSGKGLARC
jgi:hypothetical protein